MTIWTRQSLLAAVLALGACSKGVVAEVPATGQSCALDGPPTVVQARGDSRLQRWEVTETAVLSKPVLPDDPGFAAYRRAIEQAGGALRRPVADPPEPANDEERAMWEREATNAELAFSGNAGRVRPIRCLEAILFAYQNARYSQLSQPTEFIASILRKRVNGRSVLRVYVGSGSSMFPAKEFYGLDLVERDVADGWRFWVMLHNHTVQRNAGKPALGTPTLSTSDADFVRALAETLGLENAWVTNGFFTAEIPSTAFGRYAGRE